MNADRDGEAERRRRFDRVAVTYGRVGPRFFAHWGRRLVERVPLPRGADVLDVATGRGAVLYPAARRVGPQGRAVGVDFSVGMMREFARELARELAHETTCQEWRNVHVCGMDAGTLAFPDAAFDVVLCGLAVFFFPDLYRALGEMWRVLRPAGQVGLTTFAHDSAHLTWAIELLRAYDPPQERVAKETHPAKEARAAPARSSPDTSTPAGIRAALHRAGFENVRVIKEEADFVYADEAEV